MTQTILISINDQLLQLREKNDVVLDFPVSTALNGPGEEIDSECTPRGWHEVNEKIGDHAEANSIFVGRLFTGEIYSPSLREQHPQRDWILTRILRLSGLEPGKNLNGSVDTLKRYIYIHGCPDEDELGIPGSHGCIRMRNADIIVLYDLVSPGCKVLILEESLPSITPAITTS